MVENYRYQGDSGMGCLVGIYHMIRVTKDPCFVYCILFWSLGRSKKVLVVVAARGSCGGKPQFKPMEIVGFGASSLFPRTPVNLIASDSSPPKSSFQAKFILVQVSLPVLFERPERELQPAERKAVSSTDAAKLL